MSKPIVITDASFDEQVLKSETPVLVDFWAEWCGPCKMIAPVLDEISEEYKDKLYIYKINTEQEQELAAAFGVQSIPSLLFVPTEGQPQMAQGALPKEKLEEAMKDVLNVE